MRHHLAQQVGRKLAVVVQEIDDLAAGGFHAPVALLGGLPALHHYNFHLFGWVIQRAQGAKHLFAVLTGRERGQDGYFRFVVHDFPYNGSNFDIILIQPIIRSERQLP